MIFFNSQWMSISRKTACALALISALSVTCAYAGEFQFSSWDGDEGKGCLLKYSGTISAKDVGTFKVYMKKIEDCIVTNRQLQVTSNGGDLASALEIGRLIRSHLVQRSTWDYCYSSCVIILAGGVRRFPMVILPGGVPGPAKLGIHRPFTEKTDKDFSSIQKIFNASAMATKSFLREGGVSESLWDDMVKIPAENVKILTAKEAYAYGLLGGDPAFDDYLDNWMARKYREALI